MMINDIKKNELTEQEMNGVAGGYLDVNGGLSESEAELAAKMDDAFFEAVDTAWKVVKHVFDDMF